MQFATRFGRWALVAAGCSIGWTVSSASAQSVSSSPGRTRTAPSDSGVIRPVAGETSPSGGNLIGAPLKKSASATPGTGASRPAGSPANSAPGSTTGPAARTSSSGLSGTGAGTGATGTNPPGAGTIGSPKGPAAPRTGTVPPGGVAAAPRSPAWVPLAPDHEKYLDEVLRYWQDSSSKVKRYRCSFRRWEYDGVYVPRDPQTGRLPPKTESTGAIRYASPDKGMFKVERTLHFTPPAKPGEKPQWLPHKDDPTEHWVCDGKSVFSFDHQKKQLVQTMLPPEMQGRAIVDGPLPFLFGAEADKIKQRFWMRVITPKDSQGEYWLEAVPKTRQDASNFKMVHVIIDEKDFLPKAMSIFNLNHDPVRSPSCVTFSFEKRETNWNETLENLNVFQKEFWEPSTPLGYKKVVEQPDQALVDDERTKAPPMPPRQAQRPENRK